ncbi:MAG TPA: peptide deformylase [Candidatus Dojkabacteria bacterium]|nr:peptide deformylase [Candidatus Dojkabacteria bacterium]
MKYEIVTIPDKRLRMISKDVDVSETNTLKFQEFLNDLREMMYKFDGGGLSAIQLGIPKRIFVVNGEVYGNSKVDYFINPVVKPVGTEEKNDFDGCLSVRGYYGNTFRPKKVKVIYYNSKGEKVKGVFSGMISRTIHHELDHLNGILWIDRVDDLKKIKLDKRYKEPVSFDEVVKSRKPLKF